jgi:hypothetical protein
VLLRRLQIDTCLTVPTETFLTSSVCTLVVAIPAIKPKVSIGTFSNENIDNKKQSFVFPQFSRKQYRRLRKGGGSLVKDIYQLGVVLA